MVLSLLEGSAPVAVVDLGCGDGTFIADIAAELPALPNIGVEPDQGAREAAMAHAAELGLSNLQILAGDALNPPVEVAQLPVGTCFVTAFGA